MRISKTYVYEAAHQLPIGISVPEGHKCARLHGHTYRVTVYVQGEPGSNGMVMDFAELSTWMKARVEPYMDHRYLNDWLPVPTAENIAQRILAESVHLVGVRVQEGEGGMAQAGECW